MAKYPALPLWTDALVGDTYQLTPAQFGAYMRLLIVAWRRPNCDLPDDDAFLGRSIGDRKNWHRLRPVVMAFFTLGADGLYRQQRLLDERDWCSRTAARAAAGGRAKALNRQNRDAAQPLLNACLNAAPIPTTTTTEETIVSSSVVGRAASPRATRWPADEVVSLGWIGDAQASRRRHKLPEIDLRLEAERFQNFWSSKSGAQATKLDWHKTWINWTLKAEAPRNVGANGKPASAHDKFFAGVAAAISDIEAEDDHAVGGPPRNPLLPS